MTNEERIKHNESRGYILVYIGDGFEVYKKKNEVGGWTYYSDFIGCEGHYVIWDDCTRGREELLAIAKDCYGLELHEYVNRESDECIGVRIELKPGAKYFEVVNKDGISIQEAIARICTELKKGEEPGSFYYKWHHEIAGAFYDIYHAATCGNAHTNVCNETLLEIANHAAKTFLDSLCRQQKSTETPKQQQ